MEVKFSKGFEQSFNKCFSRNPFYAIPRFLRNALWSVRYVWQRVYRGYDDRLWWGYHYEMAEITVKALTRLRDEGCGHPAQYTEDEWAGRLTIMIRGFQAALDLGDIAFTNGEKERELEAKRREGFVYFVEDYMSLWD